MSTRAQIRFATREEGVSFSEHPDKINAQFYCHSDGYPAGLGIEIAESLTKYEKICGWEIEPLDTNHGDLEYIYYIWQAKEKTTWISIFEIKYSLWGGVKAYILNRAQNHTKDLEKCIFVGKPEELIEKYTP